MTETAIPITLLTGFLGAGKTTVLNGLLRHPAMAGAAVIVNEFGEVGLDHLLVRSAEENVILLDSGCLCCTINNSLRETLGELWVGRVREALPPFDRVLVETTGLAEPGPIMFAITRDPFVTEHFRLDGVVTCVDAMHAEIQLQRQPEALRQVVAADRMLLTKTDIAPRAQLDRLRERLRILNPAAQVHPVVHGEIDPAQVMGVGAFDPDRGDPDLQHWLAPHEEAQHETGSDVNRHGDIRAHCFTIDHPVSWAGLAAWCDLMAETHGDELLRVKGLLENAESAKPVVVHGVHRLFDRPRRLDRWPQGRQRGVLVVIARTLTRDYLQRTLRVLTLPSGAGRPASLGEAIR